MGVKVPGLGYKIKKNLEVFGPYYIRILIASILLMVVGSIIFTIGLHMVNYRLALPFFNIGELSSYTVYYPADHIIEHPTLLGGTIILDKEIRLGSRGIAIINAEVYTRDYTAVIVIRDSKTDALINSVVVHKKLDNYNLTLYPGTYKVYIHTDPILGLGNMTIDIKVYASREKVELIIARWLQILGLIFMGLGLVVFGLSYELARREAEADYMVPPKEIREVIARESYIRLLSSKTRYSPPKEFEVEEEE